MNIRLKLTLWFLLLPIGRCFAQCPDDVSPFSTDSATAKFSYNFSDTVHFTQPSEIVPAQDNVFEKENAQLSVPIKAPEMKPLKLWIFDRRVLALGSTLAFSVPMVMLEYQWWWRKDYAYPQHKFRYEDDGGFQNYSLGVDKCGHFFTSYLYFRTFYDLMKWADYSESTSLWTAFAVPAAHAISIELCDGFSRYSFSGVDLAANFLGMGYAYAQIKVPYLHNFNIKWSYYPSSANVRLGNEHGFAEDYTGHTYWLSMTMKNILPKGIAQYWPKYLNLAVGYGATNVSLGEDISKARHKFAFSLDYNLSAIPIADDTWAMLVRFADKFHYPAPAIKVYSGGEKQVKPFMLY